MEEQEINTITAELEKGFPGKTVQYLFDNNLHTFSIEGDGLLFCIHISHELFDDEEPIEILNEFYKFHIVNTLNQATQSVWLFLSQRGLEEVDESFAKQENH